MKSNNILNPSQFTLKHLNITDPNFEIQIRRWLNISELKQWCRDHRIKGFSGKKKHIIKLILKYYKEYKKQHRKYQKIYSYNKIFKNKDFRFKIKLFQYNRDLLDGKLLEIFPSLHHINGDKSNNSHFVKGDKYCNLGFLNSSNHSKMRGKREYEFEKILIENIKILKDGKIPKFWNKL